MNSTSIFLGLTCQRVCVAKTCSTSLVPIPKSDRSESPVGCCMAIPTDDEFSWLSSSCFWTNHVNDSLLFRTVGMFDPKLLNIFSKLINLYLRNHISNIVDIDCRDIIGQRFQNVKSGRLNLRPASRNP